MGNIYKAIHRSNHGLRSSFHSQNFKELSYKLLRVYFSVVKFWNFKLLNVSDHLVTLFTTVPVHIESPFEFNARINCSSQIRIFFFDANLSKGTIGIWKGHWERFWNYLLLKTELEPERIIYVPYFISHRNGTRDQIKKEHIFQINHDK